MGVLLTLVFIQFYLFCSENVMGFIAEIEQTTLESNPILY